MVFTVSFFMCFSMGFVLTRVLLQVLPDLLTELDAMNRRERLLSLVQGILAANIFDWGAKACVELYTNGTILDIYREVKTGA